MSIQPISLSLEAKDIAAYRGELSTELTKALKHPLQHQIEVFEAAKDHDLILDLAPTGTGKTKAGLSVLLHHPNNNKNAVYIAPTNALIEQQAKAAEAFVKDAGLPHLVKAVTAKEIRQWSNDRVGDRSGEKLYNLLRNPVTIFPELGVKRPLLLVTNPDIFYYATFFCYQKLDRTNVAKSFYSQFHTIIFDEFHLYDAKQLVGLLFYLAYLQVFGFFQTGRRVILLTATPEPECERALDILGSRGVRIKKIDGEEGRDRIPSQTPVNLEIRPLIERDLLLAEITKEITQRIAHYPDRTGAVVLDSKDHINRLGDLLKKAGLEGKFGKIHGSTPKEERESSAQKQIILATSTIDVGFNFERYPSPPRQNLDWLIFSARDRSAFWQRLGRVGRVLGKQQTDIISEAIVYLSDKAWSEGIANINPDADRVGLKQKLAELNCLNRPFIQAYWRSEAFLEVARPLLMMEELLNSLPQADLVNQLYESLQGILGGKNNWKYYQDRMKALIAAQSIAQSKPQKLKPDPLKFVKFKYPLVKVFLKSEHPEDWESLKNKDKKLKDFEDIFLKKTEAAEQLIQFSKIFAASYAPLFQFRGGLFKNLDIRDPHHFIVEESEYTNLDPIHLLRNYEFISRDKYIEVQSRVDFPYELSFAIRYYGSLEEFKNRQLYHLTAFADFQIIRKSRGAIFPTPLLKEIEKDWLPGVVIPETANQGVVYRLRKEGIESHPITVTCNDAEKNYRIFTGIEGIMMARMNGIKIELKDKEEFWVI
jgi:CRISPR-associated endonuclease/helicase Cas3